MQLLQLSLAIAGVILLSNAEILDQDKLLKLNSFNVTEMPKPQTFSFTAAPIPEFYLPQITRGPSSVTAKRNGIVTLTCAVDGWPKPTVTWYRDDTRLNPIALSALAQFTPDLIRLEVAENLPKLLNSIQFGKTIKFPTGPDVTVLGSHGYASTRHGSLVLLGVTENMVGKYHCAVKNLVGEVISSPATVSLAWMSPSFPGKHQSRIVAKHGDTVVLPCHKPNGHPIPKLQWKFGEEWLEADEFIRLDHLGHLVIEDFSQDDEGNYTCVASNGHEEISQTINVISVESLMLAMSVCPKLEEIPSEKFCQLRCQAVDLRLFLPLCLVGFALMFCSIAVTVGTICWYERKYKCNRRKVFIAKEQKPLMKASRAEPNSFAAIGTKIEV